MISCATWSSGEGDSRKPAAESAVVCGERARSVCRDRKLEDARLLVDEVRDEAHCASAGGLIVARVRPPELVEHPLEQKLAYLGQLAVHDGDHCCVHTCECGRRKLRLHERAHEHATPAKEILFEEIQHDALDIGHVDLVHQPVDAPEQDAPRHTLVLGRRPVHDGRLPQSRWHIH